VKVAQSHLTLCDPMDYIVHGILQARILEWVTFPFSRGSSQPRDWTQVFHIAGGFFTSWATGEAPIIENWLFNMGIQRKVWLRNRHGLWPLGRGAGEASQRRWWGIEMIVHLDSCPFPPVVFKALSFSFFFFEKLLTVSFSWRWLALLSKTMLKSKW